MNNDHLSPLQQDMFDFLSRLTSASRHKVEHADEQRYWVICRMSNEERIVAFTVSVIAATKRDAGQKALAFAQRTFAEAGANNNIYRWKHVCTTRSTPNPRPFVEGEVMDIMLLRRIGDLDYCLSGLSIQEALSLKGANLPCTIGAQVEKMDPDNITLWQGHVVNASGKIEMDRPPR